MRCFRQAVKMLRAKLMPSGSPSYAYRSNAKMSLPWSSRESKSILNPHSSLHPHNEASRFANWSCSFVSLSLVCRGSNRNNSFRSCSSGGAALCSRIKRHFRYNSVANAALTAHGIAIRIFPASSGAWRRALAWSKQTADRNTIFGSGTGRPCLGFTFLGATGLARVLVFLFSPFQFCSWNGEDLSHGILEFRRRLFGGRLGCWHVDQYAQDHSGGKSQ
jgi:hypothetical protein